MFRVPEVEIERPFRDPQHRIDAMNAFLCMTDYSVGLNGGGRLVYCQVANGVITWKFSFGSTADAIAFDEGFESREPEECEAHRRAFDKPFFLKKGVN